MEILAIFVAGYLFGSIPVGYLIVRKKSGSDILESGSQRSGGYNAFVVTHSRGIGILVGVLDGLKGLIPVLVVGLLIPQAFLQQCIALFAAVTGHNYPIWTRFKGGRGLATAAGGMFVIGFSYSLIWCATWAVAKLVLRRDILTSNLAAIIVTPIAIWVLPWDWVNRLILPQVDHWTFLFFSCTLSMILLLSHLDVVQGVWKGTPGETPAKIPDKTYPQS